MLRKKSLIKQKEAEEEEKKANMEDYTYFW